LRNHLIIRKSALLTGLLLGMVLTSVPVEAVIVPYTEDFSGDAANWHDAGGGSLLTYVPTGGPDGGSYVVGTFNFLGSGVGDTVPLFRAHDEFNSSHGAFVGNWVAEGVDGYSVYVRHHAPFDLTFFNRYASPNNFPAANSVFAPAVPPDTWVALGVPIPDPGFVFEGPFTYEQVFSNIGHLQVGIVVAPGLAGLNQIFTFDLDKVTVTPEPHTLTLLLLGGLLMRRTARGRRPTDRRPVPTAGEAV